VATLEFSEDEPDHIEPSSPRPTLAAPPVPPAVSTPNEPKLPGTEQESDHIDDSGTSSSYTWTQPSSPKPSLASPLAPPIVSAPNEPTLLSPDYLAPYDESYNSDYGAGLSSASDHDDPNMESQVTVEKQNSALTNDGL
jgi:hypothetical protein